MASSWAATASVTSKLWNNGARWGEEKTAVRVQRIFLGLLILSAMLLLAACNGTSGDDPTSTTAPEVEDCVADGSCSPGPEGESTSTGTTIAGWTVEGTYLGLPVGFTEEGYPFIGEPAAAVTLVEFSDYLCPFCSRHTNQTTPALLLEYGNSGEVNFVYRDFPLVGLHPTAPSGHQASLCVVEQGAVLFWEYHDTLYRQQDQWANLPDPNEYLAQTAEAIGADMAAYDECVASGRTTPIVDQRVAAGTAAGFNGTPSFHLLDNEDGSSYDIVGAQPLEVFATAVDALLAGEAPTGLTASASAVSTDTPVAAPTFTVDPETQDVYEGMTVGFTEDGLPFIGEPDAAVTVVEYSDYLCPFCFRHTTETAPTLLEQYAGGGDVNFVFVDLPLVSLHPTAPLGHQAALCVAEQGAAFFWAYHDSLFFNQSQWSSLPDPTDYLAQTAEALGVDMGAYETCMTSGTTVPIVDERVAQGTAIGFNGTPSFQFLSNSSGDVYELVGAYPTETFQSYLDAMVAGEAPPDAAADDGEPEGLPLWANEEGLAADPARPGYTVAGDPYNGNADAEVVVIEFSDFQCPACQRHALEAQPVIDEMFVDTGEVMWVYKHFPLSMHPQAAVAAAAAECAGDQGAFFEMDHLLFETQEDWSIDDPDPVFVELAGELGLDAATFSACLAGREGLERVLDDLYDATGVVSQTPTFVIVYGGQGRRLEGARSAEDFVAILETQLESANGGG